MKIFLLAAITLILAASCTTKRSFVKYGTKHRDISAQFCSETFPLRPSSTDTIIRYIESDNRNWTTTIDSLNEALITAKNTVKLDTIYSQAECNEKLLSQARTIQSLSSIIKKMRDDYEPCKPDTVLRIVTNVVPDSALVEAKNNVIKERDKELIKVNEVKDNRTAQRNWLFVAVLILCAIHVLRWFVKR